MNKTALYLIYFCVYSAALLVIGKGSLKGDDTLSGYFLSHRRVSLPLCVCTFVGTWVSAITILSLTGSIYEEGLSVLIISVFPWFFGSFLLAAVTGLLYDNDILTMPELFRKRYNSPRLQVAYGLIFIAVYIFYLVSQYKGFGMVASALFDIPYPVGVLMVYLFIMYTTVGGFRSVVRTDVFNLTLLTVSLVVIMWYVVSQAGGFSALYAQAQEISGLAHEGMARATQPGQLTSLLGGEAISLRSLSMFCGWGLGLAANPQYGVRLLGARDKKTAYLTIFCSLILLVFIYFMLVHIGLGMRVLVPSFSGPETTDEIIIRLIGNELYGAWSGFFLFSVIGASISTANSQLLLIASSFSYDVMRGLFGERISERKVLHLGRWAVVVGGTLAMLLTMNPPAVTLSYGGDVWGLVSILFFPALYGTLLSKRITAKGVWASIIAGGISVAVLYPLYYMGRLDTHPAMAGVCISACALVAGSWLDRRGGTGT